MTSRVTTPMATGQTHYSRTRSVTERVLADAVDALANLMAEGPMMHFRLRNGNVVPGSLAICFRVSEEDTDFDMMGDDAKGQIRAAPYNPVIGTINYATGMVSVQRTVAAGKLVDACYDFDVEES